ncbi:DUF4352 domain-containing protein [Streptomyces sp. B1866]|uniref:DUF4352 domain-containing protein n=1 Tax=Streptomyces sp. B1866 TaxID=3075431 RepID=UPI00288D7EA0|nr:DUF4352 domain-containing protein [Streptomyces sp. B1866]MDT3396780.1 DUF4352 domain-containing protein [Streptomyces sp. B1866]
MRRPILATAAALTLAATLAACGSDDDGGVTTKPDRSTPAAPATGGTGGGSPTAAPSPSRPAEAAVGDTITLRGQEDGERLAVTVLRWADPVKGVDEFMQPAAGKRWVAAQFRLVNTGSKDYQDSPGNGAQLSDTDGQRFESTIAGAITAGPEMTSDLNLPPGDKALGWIVFEVPKAARPAKVQFSLNSGFADQVGQWKVA